MINILTPKDLFLPTVSNNDKSSAMYAEKNMQAGTFDHHLTFGNAPKTYQDL